MEAEIEQKENEIKELKNIMADEKVCTDYLKLKELQDKITALEHETEQIMQQWAELN